MAGIAWSISDGRLVVPGSADELLTDFYGQTHNWDQSYQKAGQWLNDLVARVRSQWDLDDYQRWMSDLDTAYANEIMAPPKVPGPSGPSWWSKAWGSVESAVGKWFGAGGQTGTSGTAQTDYRWVFYVAVGLIALWALKQPSGSTKGKGGGK